MDEGLFLFMLFCGFLLFAAIIYCFLSTCLGLEIRRSDLISAFKLPSVSEIQARDRARRQRLAQRATAGDYELDEFDDVPGGGGLGGRYDRLGGMGFGGPGGPGNEELEMMRRGSRFF